MTSPSLRRCAVVLALAAAALGPAPAALADSAAAPAAVDAVATGDAQAAAAPGPGRCPRDGLLNFRSVLSGGTIRLGRSATVTGSTGRACGVQVVDDAGALISRIRPANAAFAPVQTKVGLLSFPTTFRTASVLQGPAGLGAQGLTAVLAGKVVATAEVPGGRCEIPLSLRLTTGRSGALTGRPFRDVEGVQTGRLVDGRFSVPAIRPSPGCNALTATLSNTLLGLPLEAGESTVSYDATLTFGRVS